MTEVEIQPDLLRAATGKQLVVFDYDGTLARLEVDWEGMRLALQREAAGFAFVSHFRPLWGELGRLRDERGLSHVRSLFPVIEAYERQGVERQRPRPEIAGFISSRAGTEPVVAVFSANMHATVRSGLALLGLTSVRIIVGADDVDRWKPEPLGLRRAMQSAGCIPSDTLFVGDSQGDRDAAAAAGTDFLGV